MRYAEYLVLFAVLGLILAVVIGVFQAAKRSTDDTE